MHLSFRQRRPASCRGRSLWCTYSVDRRSTSAAALSYSSMLSIVLSLALLFAILKPLGAHRRGAIDFVR